MPVNVNTYRQLATTATRAWQAMAQPNPEEKADGSVVTALDNAISDATQAWFTEMFPNAAPQVVLLDEEAALSPPLTSIQMVEELLLSDPLDGTAIFAAGGTRFTLANICHLHQTDVGVWQPQFAAALVPHQQELWYWLKGYPLTCLQFTGKPLEMVKPMTLIPQEQRDPRCIVLDIALQRQPGAFTGENHYQALYGVSVDNMLTALKHPAYAVLFKTGKPWDYALFPLLLTQGFSVYNFATGEALPAFDPQLFWDTLQQKWGSPKDGIIFLADAETDPQGYIAALRQYVNFIAV